MADIMHYDAGYYESVYSGFEDAIFAQQWALGCALTGGYANQRYRAVLEFGAGLGQNLAVLNAETKWAVDVNQSSQSACENQGFHWTSVLHEVPDNTFDMILSRHSLEHTTEPLKTLQELRRKGKLGSCLVLVIPLETSRSVSSLTSFDEHKHLFAWSPESIKNLLLESGWKPQQIWVHNGRMFRRMLPLLPRHPALFLKARKCISLLTPQKSAEIIIRAVI